MTTEKPCSDHPDAPHGFVRNASHSVGHYVCECSGWTPPEPKSLQERLRNSVGEDDLQVCMDEAADRIDLDAAHIDTLAKVVDKLQTERDALVVKLGEPSLRYRIRVHLANRYAYSHGDFCTKLDEILEESK